MDTDLVVIGGLPGSGTSTVAQLLSRRLGWDYVNAGELFRGLAREAGLSLAEFGRCAERNGRIDRELDARMVARARQGGGLVLEGRLTGWMAVRHRVPALKVWLRAPGRVRAARISRREGRDLEETLAAMQEREQSERRRYLEYHDIDLGDLSIYDLVVDSESHSAGKIAARILAHLQE